MDAGMGAVYWAAVVTSVRLFVMVRRITIVIIRVDPK
jgi:hypothetical protein